MHVGRFIGREGLMDIGAKISGQLPRILMAIGLWLVLIQWWDILGPRITTSGSCKRRIAKITKIAKIQGVIEYSYNMVTSLPWSCSIRCPGSLSLPRSEREATIGVLPSGCSSTKQTISRQSHSHGSGKSPPAGATLGAKPLAVGRRKKPVEVIQRD